MRRQAHRGCLWCQPGGRAQHFRRPGLHRSQRPVPVGYSWANNGKTVDFMFSPTGQAQDEWTGKAIVQALTIGGEVAARLTTDASWTITDLRMPVRLGGDKVIGAGAGGTTAQVPLISAVAPNNGPAAGKTRWSSPGSGSPGHRGRIQHGRGHRVHRRVQHRDPRRDPCRLGRRRRRGRQGHTDR